MTSQLASEVLEKLEAIASHAAAELRAPPPSSEVLADPSEASAGKLAQISTSLRESISLLCREPAIARVVVTDGAENTQIYYICRATPVGGLGNLASYRSPIGRLAALPLHGELALPNGRLLEVTGKARLHPVLAPAGWDSHDSLLELAGSAPVTIASLPVSVNIVVG